MAQAPKKQRQRKVTPKDMELPDHDLMEKIVGKRVMKAVDADLAEWEGPAGEEDRAIT